VRVELGVDVPQVRSHRVCRDEQLRGDLARPEVAGQVSHDAQLRLAELVQQRSRLAAPLRRGAAVDVGDRRQKGAVGAAVPGVALDQGADGRGHEGQDQAFGLGQLERPLDRLLGRASVAQLLAGGRVEQR
jgi:hypothetical protein